MRAYNKIELEKVAKETGFIRDNLEKVVRLSNILEFLVSNDSLKRKLVLKGGTAINLTVFDMPRLSVDIDLDYCCNSDKDTMMADRAVIGQEILGHMQSNGEYKPELLFDDGKIIERIEEHPMALWKINEVK